jgi:hypothetical protein
MFIFYNVYGFNRIYYYLCVTFLILNYITMITALLSQAKGAEALVSNRILTAICQAKISACCSPCYCC